MPEWCVSCWMRSRSRTPATRSLEDDPLCDRCADQYRSDEVADQKSDRDGEAVQELESPAASPVAAAPVKPASATTGFSSDQEASPGSFGPAIKKAFLPKPEKADSQKETTMDEPRRTCAAEGCPARLNAANRSGRCSKHWYVKKTEKPALAEKRQSKRAQTKAPVSQPLANGTAAESRKVLIDVPEAFLDSFFAKLPIERKVQLFQQELAASR